VALEHRDDFAIHLNVANHGSIEGVAPEFNVETPVEFRNGVLTRKSIRFQDPAIAREIDRFGKEQ
jgi:alpha-galactosidase/6-phospho-beta-glucosidase family protein